MKKLSRIVVTVKDIQLIYGYTQPSAWRKLKEIRTFFEKPPGSCVTIHELSIYTTIAIDILEEFFN